MRRVLFALVAVVSLALAGPAVASDFSLSGTATVQGDTVKLVSDFSDTSATNDFGAVAFTVPAGTTFGSLTHLAAVYNVTDDDCGGGSPRFQINVGGKNVFVYLGPSPSFTGCAQNTFLNSGNLVGTTDACRVDTSQFTGGKQCSTWAEAVALLGSQAVTGIQFVVDGGWKMTDHEQTVLLRSVTINSTTYRFGSHSERGKHKRGKVVPGQVCNAMRERMGREAFNELWSTHGTSNGMGKCASALAHARKAGKTHEQIMEALAACIAQGKRGAALGACVAARDGVAVTRTEAEEAKAAKDKSRKGKGKRTHR